MEAIPAPPGGRIEQVGDIVKVFEAGAATPCRTYRLRAGQRELDFYEEPAPAPVEPDGG